MIRKIMSLLAGISLLFQQVGFAQMAMELNLANHLSRMGSSVSVDKFRPFHLRYFSYDTVKDDFKFLFDKGDLKDVKEPQSNELTSELLKYFLIGITLPDSKFWVNLRPDSEDQIIDPELEKTDLGKVLLEADLQLKKDTAMMTSPQTPEGREYWNNLYKKAEELFGSESVTIPTLTRPWIVPGEIIVRETQDSAFLYKTTLKVMLEQDHLKDSAVYNFKDERLKKLNEYSSELIREKIIPKLTKEVNSSKKYAALRQVFYSLVLSRWFKARFKGQEGVYSSLIDTQNLNGLTSTTKWSKTTYFQAYQKSFNDGEYNIKEPVYTPTGQVIRSYFSGGFSARSEDLNRKIFGFGSAGSPINFNRLFSAEGLRKVSAMRKWMGDFADKYIWVDSKPTASDKEIMSAIYDINARENLENVKELLRAFKQQSEELERMSKQGNKDTSSPIKQSSSQSSQASTITEVVPTKYLTWGEALSYVGFYRPRYAWQLTKFDRVGKDHDQDDFDTLAYDIGHLIYSMNKKNAAILLTRWIERGESEKAFIVLFRACYWARNDYKDQDEFRDKVYQLIGPENYEKMLTEAFKSKNYELKGFVVQDPLISDTLMETIYHNEKSEVSEEMFKNSRNLPESIQRDIALKGSESLKARLANKEYVLPEVLSSLAKDGMPLEVVKRAAGNQRLPLEDLRRLNRHQDHSIREAVKRNRAVSDKLYKSWQEEWKMEREAKMKGEPSRSEILVKTEKKWGEYYNFISVIAAEHNILGYITEVKDQPWLILEGGKEDISNLIERLKKQEGIRDVVSSWYKYEGIFSTFEQRNPRQMSKLSQSFAEARNTYDRQRRNQGENEEDSTDILGQSVMALGLLDIFTTNSDNRNDGLSSTAGESNSEMQDLFQGGESGGAGASREFDIPNVDADTYSSTSNEPSSSYDSLSVDSSSPISEPVALSITRKEAPAAPGGIDFRVMNIVTQPMAGLTSLSLTLPQLGSLAQIDLDEEMQLMKNMLAAGNLPSGDRIKEYVAACYQKGEWADRAEDVIACLIEVCQLQEEEASETPTEIKEVMIIVDSLSAAI